MLHGSGIPQGEVKSRGNLGQNKRDARDQKLLVPFDLVRERENIAPKMQLPIVVASENFMQNQIEYRLKLIRYERALRLELLTRNTSLRHARFVGCNNQTAQTCAVDNVFGRSRRNIRAVRLRRQRQQLEVLQRREQRLEVGRGGVVKFVLKARDSFGVEDGLVLARVGPTNSFGFSSENGSKRSAINKPLKSIVVSQLVQRQQQTCRIGDNPRIGSVRAECITQFLRKLDPEHVGLLQATGNLKGAG